MPLILEPEMSAVHHPPKGQSFAGQPLLGVGDPGGDCLNIGLINNMPDAALQATERQYRALLGTAAASNGLTVRLLFYRLPEIPRNGLIARHVRESYSSVEDLFGSRLDGLIVTGKEPKAQDLADEPYWNSLTAVLEWARENTHSTIWSCLAAHAAIQHLDGIRRRRNAHKHFGVLECHRVSDHPLMADTPPSLWLPHSRWNDVPEHALADSGYEVITRTKSAGVDTFVKQVGSLFVFFQGHPEYECDTLLLEYRRDLGRYLRRETDSFPTIPCNYFEKETEKLLRSLQARVSQEQADELTAGALGIVQDKKIVSQWRPTATKIYTNWLQYLCAERKKRACHYATAGAAG
jgi:homoserine O-succinyltransferase